MLLLLLLLFDDRYAERDKHRYVQYVDDMVHTCSLSYDHLQRHGSKFVCAQHRQKKNVILFDVWRSESIIPSHVISNSDESILTDMQGEEVRG